MQPSPLLATHLHLLACPVCYGTLALDPATPPQHIDCTACHRRYPIHDGLPVLIANRATQF